MKTKIKICLKCGNGREQCQCNPQLQLLQLVLEKINNKNERKRRISRSAV